MDPKHPLVDYGSRSEGVTSWLNQKNAQRGEIKDQRAEGVNPSNRTTVEECEYSFLCTYALEFYV